MALIDKETIRAEIKRRIKIYGDPHAGDATQYDVRKKHALVGLLEFIDTLPEQPDSEEKFRNLLDAMGDCGFSQDDILLLKSIWEDAYSTSKEQPVEKQVSPKDKFVFPNFLYARTVDNKTIDVSYVPQSLDAVEYAKNNPTEQPVEGLEEEIDRLWESFSEEMSGPHNLFDMYRRLARHFAEWGAEQKSIEIFKKQNCQGCGTQRCTGDGEWLEGCAKYQKWRTEHLKK